MTGPAQPPAAPSRAHLLRHNVKALVRKPSAIRHLIACQHRYPDGTSAWSPCKQKGDAWYSVCRICLLMARCT